MRVDQAGENSLAAEVHHLGPRAAFRLQNVGARARSRDTAILCRKRLHHVECRVYGDDLAVVQDEVGIRRTGGQAQ